MGSRQPIFCCGINTASRRCTRGAARSFIAELGVLSEARRTITADSGTTPGDSARTRAASRAPAVDSRPFYRFSTMRSSSISPIRVPIGSKCVAVRKRDRTNKHLIMVKLNIGMFVSLEVGTV
jgi:hypothetical protein